MGLSIYAEPTPVTITFSISSRFNEFSFVNFPKAPYIDVMGSVALTSIGANSFPLSSIPTILVVLPPTSIPITTLIISLP